MAYTVIEGDDPTLETAGGGALRKLRKALGVTAFGIHEIHLDAGQSGKEHDETRSGQEEVYTARSGSGHLVVDGERVPLAPGRYVRVPPGSTRTIEAGPDGIVMLVVGGVPGGVYEPAPWFS